MRKETKISAITGLNSHNSATFLSKMPLTDTIAHKEKTEEKEFQSPVVFFLPDNGRGNFDNLTPEEKAEYDRLVHKANGKGGEK